MSSAGQAVGAVVGGVVGFMVGGPAGAVYGAQIGMGVGGMIDPPKGPTINGPRLSDLSAQTSTYGSPIPRIYGTVATLGNVIWLQGNKLTERVRKEKQGGKGGGGGATVKTYSYYATFAVGLADTTKTGPIQGVRRIWVAGNLIYDAGGDDLETIIASNQAAQGFRIYYGDEDQLPDPRMQADLGVDNCPAYRGLAYIVFYDFALKDYGNSLMAAQVKVEVASGWNEPNFIRSVNEDSTFAFGSAGSDRDGLPYIDSVDGVIVNVRFRGDSSWQRLVSAGIRLSVSSSIESPLPPSGFGYVNPCGYIGGRSLYAFTGTPPNGIRLGYGPIDFGSVYERIGTPVDALIPSGESISAVSIANNESSILVLTDGEKWYELTLDGAIIRYGSVGPGVDVGGIARGGSRSYYATSFDSERGEIACVFGASNGLVSFHRIEGSTLVLKATSNLSFFDFSYPSVYLQDGIIYAVTGPDVNVFAYAGASGAPERLDEIIKAECLQSGILSLPDIDATDIDQDVRGYRIAQTGAIRGALEPLQGAWPFDVIQAGYKIKFVRRGKTSASTIDATLLDARQGDSAPGVQVTLANEMDTQLPRAVSLKYLDIGREYDMSEQAAERLNTDAVNMREMEMPIVLTATEAAGMSEVLLYLYWLERRDVSFRLPPQFRYLEPADVITITGEWGQYELRLTRINLESDGRLACSAKFNAAAIYTPTAQGAEGEAPAQAIPLDGPSVYIMLDVPMLSDNYNSPGWPVAMAGYTAGWPGGVIYRSVDGGQTWTDLQGFSSPVTMGYARGMLGDGRFDIVDASSVLDVDMMAGDVSSIDEVAQFAGGNTLAYGAPGRWEICSPRTVTLNADGSLSMTDWLRGRFGTEWAASLHQSGDALVLLTDQDLAWVGMDSGSIGMAREYRGITAGRSIDTDTNRSETYAGVNLKPLSPVYINGHITPGTLDWTLTWTRRGRVSPEWRSSVDVPIGEASEAYEVDIYDNAGFFSVVRTISSNTASATYTYVQQLQDFGSVRSVLYVRVYQISAVTGRGYPLSTSISRDLEPSDDGGGYFYDPFTRLVKLNDGSHYLLQTSIRGASPQQRILGSSDGGLTFSLVDYSDSLWAGISGVRYWDAKYGSRRFSILYNDSANIRQVITQDGGADPVVTDVKDAYPNTGDGSELLFADAFADSACMYLIGRERFDPAPMLYSTSDGLILSSLGAMTLHTSAYGNPYFAWSNMTSDNTSTTTLKKIGSRWFMLTPKALFYTDESIPLQNWKPASVGLGESGAIENRLIHIDATVGVIVVANQSGSGNCISYSSDGGGTWATLRPSGMASLSRIDGLVAAGGKFHAYNRQSPSGLLTVWQSTPSDPGSWSGSTVSLLTQQDYSVSEYGGSVIMDIGGGKLRTSMDGINFTATVIPPME